MPLSRLKNLVSFLCIFGVLAFTAIVYHEQSTEQPVPDEATQPTSAFTPFSSLEADEEEPAQNLDTAEGIQEQTSAPMLGQGVNKGRLRVDAQPKGEIFVDGKTTGKKTPYTVDAPLGARKVKVVFSDSGESSREKTVNVRPGSMVNLFFQKGQKEPEDLTFEEEEPKPKKKRKRMKKWPPSVLVVVTNFDKADINVNGLPYPEYDEEEEGMVLPSGGPYTVTVAYAGSSRVYTLSLKPYETRYLIVELSGLQGGVAAKPYRDGPPKAKPAKKKKKEKAKDDKKDESGGRITVYSKPRGTILLDGKEMGKKTPNTIDAEQGRHEVQVKYTDSNQISEKKIVRIRKGSRIKLFFREAKK